MPVFFSPAVWGIPEIEKQPFSPFLTAFASTAPELKSAAKSGA